MMYQNLQILTRAVELFRLRLSERRSPSFSSCLRDAVYMETGFCPDCGYVGSHAQGCHYLDRFDDHYKKDPPGGGSED